jgi:hypothetical protein
VDEWVDGLNAFVRAEMVDYIKLTPDYLKSLGDAASAGSFGHADGNGTLLDAPLTVGGAASAEAAVSGGEQAADSIWEAVGGYEHPQPGSRLLQYGECLTLFASLSFLSSVCALACICARPSVSLIVTFLRQFH